MEDGCRQDAHRTTSAKNGYRLHVLYAQHTFNSVSMHMCIRACLDQLLIAIRSSLIVCDHMRSKTRLIAIIRLIAKLGIIDTTWLQIDVLSIVSLPPHRSINTARG